jgi:hypothetical protein
MDKEAQLCDTSERRKIVVAEEETKRMKSEIGSRIVEAFDYRSVAKIASLLRISNKTVKSYIVGDEFPTIEILLDIHRLTGSSLDWLLTGRETKQESRAHSFAVSNEPEILGLA